MWRIIAKEVSIVLIVGAASAISDYLRKIKVKPLMIDIEAASKKVD